MHSNPLASLRVQICLSPGAILPQTQTIGASGYDLCAYLEQPISLEPGQRVLVPTGVSLAIPSGFEAQIRPRSGLAYKHGITCLNSPGTIDADYRGMLKVLLINLSQESYQIVNAERIAQLVFSPVMHPHLEIVSELTTTTRGKQGFGHTGIKP